MLRKKEKRPILTPSLERSVLDWWYKRRGRVATWGEEKKALLSQYRDNFVENNARRDLEDLLHTRRDQDYLAEVEKLNGHADDIIIALIYWKIKLKLWEMIAFFHAMRRSDPHPDFIRGGTLEQNVRLTRSDN